MIETCAADGYNDIASLMAAVDCHVAAYVTRAYRGLFGQGGWLTSALAGGLTIYVAIYGYRLIMGGGATVPDLVRRFVAMGFVIALSSNWPAYQTVFVNTITGGAEEVARMMSVATTGRAATSANVAESLNIVVGDMTDLAANWSRRTPLGAQTVDSFTEDAARAATPPPQQPLTPPQATPAGISAPTMLWISAILIGVSSAGVIVITKITLGFLLALGPVFILFGLFQGTRGLLEGWLRSIVGGSFVLVFALLATAGALTIITPMTDEIARNQMLGDNSVGAVFALTVASIIFAMLIRQVLTSTAQLVAAWRLPDRFHADKSAAAEITGQARDHAQAAGDSRIIDMVASVSRNDTGAGAQPSRAAAVSPISAHAAFDSESGADVADIRRASRAYRGFGSTRARAARGLP